MVHNLRTSVSTHASLDTEIANFKHDEQHKQHHWGKVSKSRCQNDLVSEHKEFTFYGDRVYEMFSSRSFQNAGDYLAGKDAISFSTAL